MKATRPALRQTLRQSGDVFLSLFPHRFDYIWAAYPDPGESPAWQTETRHPLSDRLIQQGTSLYGVRFGAQTCYCLLDIDAASPYHPAQDPLAISRMLGALECLGLVSFVACTSSDSGGLHLYFPFQQAQSSWKLAIAVTTVLENAGFKLKPGQLEVFPDPKPYSVNSSPSLFNAHRLPLQIGSYLLDQNFQPVWSTQQNFVQKWKFSQVQNDIQASVIRQVLKQLKRYRYMVSTKADKFINDLNAEIEVGWTDHGQTNYLLGRITMREYIFRHVLTGGSPLQGDALIQAIVDVARSLPGYSEYCRHQHEIEHRAREWARCIEDSHYFHYGDAAGKFKAKLSGTESDNSDLEVAIAETPTWNQQQSEGARDRIRRAIADLLDQGTLPASATARFHALTRYGIGGSTLYNHRDLWHPDHLMIDSNPTESFLSDGSVDSSSMSGCELPPDPPASISDREGNCFGEAFPSHSLTSLFTSSGRNTASDAASSDPAIQPDETGRNSQSSEDPMIYVQQVLWQIKATQADRRTAAQMTYEQQQHLKQQASQARQLARMQQFLDSKDPILRAEAIAWAAANPELAKQLRDIP